MISLFSIVALTVLFGASNCSCYKLDCPNLREGGDDGYRSYGDEDDLYEGGHYGSRNKYKLPASCDSEKDNTRGRYTTALKPCIFTFHKSEKDDGTSFQASTVCSEKNRIHKEIIKEYVRMWPDECVGDFARCYSVKRDENIFKKFFCQTKPDWKIPEDTTHISVSCIDDKQAKILENMNGTRHGDDNYFAKESAAREKQFLLQVEKQEEHMRHLEVVAIVAFVLSFSACLVIVKCAYSWLLRPYYDKLAAHVE